MNCAHLENRLHEAREEAHTHLCAAERRASEYSALRATAVKMRGLFERFRVCVTASVPVASFADSLRSLSLSLARYARKYTAYLSCLFGMFEIFVFCCQIILSLPQLLGFP